MGAFFFVFTFWNFGAIWGFLEGRDEGRCKYLLELVKLYGEAGNRQKKGNL